MNFIGFLIIIEKIYGYLLNEKENAKNEKENNEEKIDLSMQKTTVTNIDDYKAIICDDPEDFEEIGDIKKPKMQEIMLTNSKEATDTFLL